MAKTREDGPSAAPSFMEGVVAQPGHNSGAQLHDMINQKIALETELAELALKAEEVRKKLEALTRVDMPNVMKELRQREFTDDDGFVCKLRTKLSVSVSKENAPLAIKFLEGRKGGDGIIKREVVIPIGRGPKKDVQVLVNQLKKLKVGEFKLQPIVEASVHPSTLKKYVGEEMQKGVAFPDDVFKIFEFEEVEVKAPKKEAGDDAII